MSEEKTIEILNFEKYNPRRDIFKPTWLRIQNNISFDPQFDGFKPYEKWFWVFVLSMASLKNSQKIKCSDSFLSKHSGLTISQIKTAIQKLEQNQCVRVTSEVITDISRRDAGEQKNNATDITDITNNTNITGIIKEIAKNANSPQAAHIIEYLNSITGKKFRVGSETNLGHIRARLNEGYTVDDLKKVIDIKTHDIFFAKNPHLFNPQTLFGSGAKVEKYLNQEAPNLTSDALLTEEEVRRKKIYEAFIKKGEQEQNG